MNLAPSAPQPRKAPRPSCQPRTAACGPSDPLRAESPLPRAVPRRSTPAGSPAASRYPAPPRSPRAPCAESRPTTPCSHRRRDRALVHHASLPSRGASRAHPRRPRCRPSASRARLSRACLGRARLLRSGRTRLRRARRLRGERSFRRCCRRHGQSRTHRRPRIRRPRLAPSARQTAPSALCTRTSGAHVQTLQSRIRSSRTPGRLRSTSP